MGSRTPRETQSPLQAFQRHLLAPFANRLSEFSPNWVCQLQQAYGVFRERDEIAFCICLLHWAGHRAEAIERFQSAVIILKTAPLVGSWEVPALEAGCGRGEGVLHDFAMTQGSWVLRKFKRELPTSYWERGPGGLLANLKMRIPIQASPPKTTPRATQS